MTDEFKPLIDWLTYRSYEANRSANPHIPDYKWRKIFKDAIVFEEIYERYIRHIQNTIKIYT